MALFSRSMVFLLALSSLACGPKNEEVAGPQNASSVEEGAITTVFSAPNSSRDGSAPVQEVKPPPVEPPTDRPPRKMSKSYPPPISPPAPMAPRGPPVPPRYVMEPPPSRIQALPDFKVDKVGVWECDDFTAQYLACINQRVPRNRDEKKVELLAEKVGRWKGMTATEAGKGEAIKECQAALLKAKKAMQPYGCLWH